MKMHFDIVRLTQTLSNMDFIIILIIYNNIIQYTFLNIKLYFVYKETENRSH